MALAGAIAGHHGNITVATTSPPNYDHLTGELHRWELTIQNDRYDATTFLADPSSGNTTGYRVVAKGMYQVRGTISGFWDTAGATTSYEAFKPERAAVAIDFISRDAGAVGTDQKFTMNCKLNNYSITVNKQTGLVSFSADVVGEGNITSVTSYT